MTSIAQVSAQMQWVLTEVADAAGRVSGCVRRVRKLRGSSLVQTLVFGWLANPAASLEELSQAAGTCGVTISAQGLAERFTAQAATCLRMVLEAGLEQVVEAEGGSVGALGAFNGVYVQDSTTLSLPAALGTLWAGCGNQNGTSAGLKVQTVLDYSSGGLHLNLEAGRASDKTAGLPELPVGALYLADSGYFSIRRLQALTQRGVHWLTRLPANVQCVDAQQRVWSAPEWLATQVVGDHAETQVYLSHHRFPARLLVQRVPPAVAQQRRARLQREALRRNRPPSPHLLALCEWTLLVTDLPAQRLDAPAAFTFMRVRWQIELLFKLWKSGLRLSPARSANPWRVLCEVYAKLIALLIQHWLLLMGCADSLDRSWFKAAPTIHKHAFHLAAVLYDTVRLVQAIALIARTIARCRSTKRRAHPSTFQRLSALAP